MPDDLSENEPEDAGHELISRLRIIENQPLADRAAAYAAVHDELATRLEANPLEAGAGRTR